MSMTFDTDVVVNNGKSVQTNKVLAPTESGGSTYGAGTSGQVLTSSGSGTYWGTPNAGTVTGVKMNSGSAISPDANGVVDLGTVITSHQTLPDGSTSAKGMVQLEDSTSSTSTTKAATSNSVKLAKDAADSAATAAAGKANPASVLTVSAASGSWTSATPPTQSISATGVTASNNIIVGLDGTATSTQFDEWAAGKILCTAQAADSITLTAYGTKPTGNIPVSVVILG